MHPLGGRIIGLESKRVKRFFVILEYMRRAMAFGIASISALAIVACSDGESASDPYREAAENAVESAVLTLDDLPDAWAVSSLGEDSYANIQLTGDCAKLNARGAGFPGEVATTSADPFAGPNGQELVNTVTAFSDPQAAEAALGSADTLVAQCTDQINSALQQAIEVAAEDRNIGGLLGDINTAVEPDNDFPPFGSESLAYNLQADFSALFARFEVTGHIIAIREGALAGVLVYAALGDNGPQEERDIAAALAGKLAAADATLPR
jgi:hypothetical protein